MYTATERRKKQDVQVSDPTVALERPVLVMEAKETGEGVQSKIHNPNLQSKTGNNYAQEGGQSESKEQAPWNSPKLYMRNTIKLEHLTYIHLAWTEQTDNYKGAKIRIKSVYF